MANFNLPNLYLELLLGVTPPNFADIFGIRKLESLIYCKALFLGSYVEPSGTIPVVVNVHFWLIYL